MRTLPSIFSLCLLLSSLVATPASGQQDSHPPAKFIGLAMMGYSTGLEPESPDGSLGFLLSGFSMIEAGIGLGVEVGRQQLGSFEITDVPPNSNMPVTDTIDQDLWQLTGNLMGRVTHGSVRPHFNTGLGLYWVETTTSQSLRLENGTETRFGFNVGGGFSVGPAAKRWAIGVDGRWHAVVNGWIGNSTLNTLTVYAGLILER